MWKVPTIIFFSVCDTIFVENIITWYSKYSKNLLGPHDKDWSSCSRNRRTSSMKFLSLSQTHGTYQTLPIQQSSGESFVTPTPFVVFSVTYTTCEGPQQP